MLESMSPSRRLAATAAALLLLGAQATGLFHLLLAPHEICPVDGELVEGGPAPRTHGAWAPGGATPHARGDGAAPAHPHERCLAMPGEVDALPSLGPTPALVTLQSTPLVFAPGAGPPSPGPPLYRLAPKTSPPA
jgi:hypothetical protein